MLSYRESISIQKDAGTSEYFRMNENSPLVQLLVALSRREYRFCTVTPATHHRVMLKRTALSADLRDIFGWNMPFVVDALPTDIAKPMCDAGIIRIANGLATSTVRVASLDSDLFLHSSYPTVDPQAVFFGPDTYRFARFITSAIECLPDCELSPDSLSLRPVRILDVGCGSGAGGIVAARAIRAKGFSVELVLSDINPEALVMTKANALAANLEVICALGDTLSAVDGEFDFIISNPPYLYDDAERIYRHGGERLGRALSVRIAAESLKRLASNGRLLLYTGVAMVDECDPLLTELFPMLDDADYAWTYDEIDPDVFGEELDRPIYDGAHRIAAIGLVVHYRSPIKNVF